MKRTTILVALICFLLSSFPSIGFTQTQHNETDQPALSSESLEEWIRLLQSEDDAQRILAAQQLHRMEKPNLRALPYLTKALFDKERKVVILSAQTIGSLGKEAKPALPMLVKKLTCDDDYLVLAIGMAIGAIGGPENELAVKELLMRKSPKMGTPFLYKGYSEQFPAATFTHLSSLSRQGTAKVRRSAIDAIGYLFNERHPVPKITLSQEQRDNMIKHLYEELEDTNLSVRFSAARALVNIEKKHRAYVTNPFVEAIALQLKDSQDAVDLLKADPETAVPALHAALMKNLFINPLDGTMALAHMPAESQIALKDCLGFGTAPLKLAAAKALGHYTFWQHRQQATEILLDGLNDTDDEVALTAAESIVGHKTEQAIAAIATLNRLLLDESLDKKIRAANALFLIGPNAKETVPSLMKAMNQKNEAVQLSSALALVEIDKGSALKTLPILAAAIENEDLENLELRQKAVQAAGELGEVSLPLIKSIEQLIRTPLGRKYGLLQVRAAEAVIKIDPSKTAACLKEMERLVTDSKYHSTITRKYAIDGLVRYGNGSVTATDALAEIAARKIGGFRPRAAVARIKIDPDRRQLGWDIMLGKFWTNNNDRKRVIRAMVEYNVDPINILAELIAFVKEQPDIFGVHEAIELIGRCGPEAKSAIPTLKNVLDHKQQDVRDAAKRSLELIQPRGDGASF